MYFQTPLLRWQTSFIQPQMHPYDLYFYDPIQGVYTVDKYLDDVSTRYGGIDSMLIWPTYTNLGADDRNQVCGTARARGTLSIAVVKGVLWVQRLVA